MLFALAILLLLLLGLYLGSLLLGSTGTGESFDASVVDVVVFVADYYAVSAYHIIITTTNIIIIFAKGIVVVGEI